MELAQVLTNLRQISDYFKTGNPDSIRTSKLYCDKLSKFLKTISGLRDKSYDDYIFVLWVVLDQFGQMYDSIRNGDHRDRFCQNLFIVCAKAVLGIQWQKLDDDSECKINFRSTVELVHARLQTTDFCQFEQVLELMDTHWSDPVLTQVMSGSEECDEEEAMKYILGEAPIVLALRVDMLVEENCEEFALNLCNKCVAHPKLKQDADLREKQLLLMQKLNNFEELQEQCQTISCELAVEILKKWENKRARKKFLVRLLQLFVVQEWLRPPQENKFKVLICMWIRQQFLTDGNQETFRESVWAIAKMSYRVRDTSRIHLLLEGLALVCGDTCLQLCTDISIYAINLDMKFLETAESESDSSEIIILKKAMSVTCRIISAMFEKKNLKLCRFSALTSFSLLPSNETMSVVERVFSVGDPLKPEPKNLASMYDGSKTSPCKCLLTSLTCFCAKDIKPEQSAGKHIELMLPAENSEIKDFSNEFLKFLQTKDDPGAKEEEEVNVEDLDTVTDSKGSSNSANDTDTKIDPATLYELERQLDMNRSPTLSPYLAWNQLLVVCRNHINEFGMIDENVGPDWFGKKATKDAATTCMSDMITEKGTAQGDLSYFMNSGNTGKKNEFGEDLVTDMMNNLSTDTGSKHVKRPVVSFFPSHHQAERDNSSMSHGNAKSASEHSRFSDLHKYSSLLQQSLKSPLESISSGQLLSLSKIQKSPPRCTNPVSPKGHVAHGFPFVSFQKIQDKAQSHHIISNSGQTMTVGKLLSATAKKSVETVGKSYGSEKAVDPHIRQLDTPDLPTKVPHLLLGKLQSPSKSNGKAKLPNSVVKTSLNVTKSELHAEQKKESVMSDHDYRHHVIQPSKASKVSMKRHATKVCKNMPEVIMKRLESLSDSNQPQHIAVPYPENMDPRLIPPGWYKVRLVNGQNVLLKGNANVVSNHEKKQSQQAKKPKQSVSRNEEPATTNTSSHMYVASIIDSVRAAQQYGSTVSNKGRTRVTTSKAASLSSQASVGSTVANTGHVVANSKGNASIPCNKHIRSSLATTSPSAVSLTPSSAIPAIGGGQLPSIFTIFQRPTSTVGSIPSAHNATAKSDMSRASLVDKVHSLIHGFKPSGVDESSVNVAAENRQFTSVEDTLTNTVKSVIMSSRTLTSATALDALATAAIMQDGQRGIVASLSNSQMQPAHPIDMPPNVQNASIPLSTAEHRVPAANLKHSAPVNDFDIRNHSNQPHSISSAHSSTDIQNVQGSVASTEYSTYQILLSPNSKVGLKHIQAGVKSTMSKDILIATPSVTVSESDVITTTTVTMANSVNATETETNSSAQKSLQDGYSPKSVKKLLQKAAMYRLKAKGMSPHKGKDEPLLLLKYHDVSPSSILSAEHEHFQKTVKLASHQVMRTSVYGSENATSIISQHEGAKLGPQTEGCSVEAETVSSGKLLENSGGHKTVECSQTKAQCKQVPGIASSLATSVDVLNVVTPFANRVLSSKRQKIVKIPFSSSTLTSSSPIRIKAKSTKSSEPSQGQKMAAAAVDAVQNQQALYGAFSKGETRILPKLVKMIPSGKAEKPIYPQNQPQYVTSVAMNPGGQIMPKFVPNISISQPTQLHSNSLNFPVMDQGFLASQNIPLTGVVHNVSNMSQVASSLPPASIDVLNQNFDSSMYVIMDVTNSQGSQPLTTIVLQDTNGGLLQNQMPLNSYLLESLQMQAQQSLQVLQPPMIAPVQSKPIDLSLGILPAPPVTMTTVMSQGSSGEVTPTNGSDVVHGVAQLSEVTLGSPIMPFNMPVMGLPAMSSFVDGSIQLPQDVGNMGALSMQAFGTLPQTMPIYSNGVNNMYGIPQMPPVFYPQDVPLNIAQTLTNSSPTIPIVVPLSSESTALTDISLNATATDVSTVTDIEQSMTLDDKQASGTPDMSETFTADENLEDSNSIDNLVSELSTLQKVDNFDAVNDPESIMLPEDQPRHEELSMQKASDMERSDEDIKEPIVSDEEYSSVKNVADDLSHAKDTANDDEDVNTETNKADKMSADEAIVKEDLQELLTPDSLPEDIDRNGILTIEDTQDNLFADEMNTSFNTCDSALNAQAVDGDATLLPEQLNSTSNSVPDPTADCVPEYCSDPVPTEVKYGITEELDVMKEPTNGELLDPESVSAVEEESRVLMEDIPVNIEDTMGNAEQSPPSASVGDHISENIALESLEHTKPEQSIEGISPQIEAKTLESDGINSEQNETLIKALDVHLDSKERNISPQCFDNQGQQHQSVESHDETGGKMTNDMPRIVEDAVMEDESLEPTPKEGRIHEAESIGQVMSSEIQSICSENNLQDVTLNLRSLEEISETLPPVKAECNWNNLEMIDTVASSEDVVLQLEFGNSRKSPKSNEERTSPESDQTLVEAVHQDDEDKEVLDEQVQQEKVEDLMKVTSAEKCEVEKVDGLIENNTLLLTTDSNSKPFDQNINRNDKCLNDSENVAQKTSAVLEKPIADGEALECICPDDLDYHKETFVPVQDDLAKYVKDDGIADHNDDTVVVKEADDSCRETVADQNEFITSKDEKTDPVHDDERLSYPDNVSRSAVINSEENKTLDAIENNYDDQNGNLKVVCPVKDLASVCKYIVDTKLENTFACQEKRLQQSSVNHHPDKTNKTECLSVQNDNSHLTVPNTSAEDVRTWSNSEKPPRDQFSFENDTELSSRSITPVSSNSRNGSPVSWTGYSIPVSKILKCSIKKSVNFANINLKKYFATCYRCAICNLFFRKLYLLRNHIRSICKPNDLPRYGSKDPPICKEDPSYCYTCLRCRGTIKAKTEILHHLQFCYNVDPYEIENQDSSVNLTPQKTYRCPACNRSMTQEELLTTHPELCPERPKLQLRKEKMAVPIFLPYHSEDSDCSEAITAEKDADRQKAESDEGSVKKTSRSQTPVGEETSNIADKDIENRTGGLTEEPAEDMKPLNEHQQVHDTTNEEYVRKKGRPVGSCKGTKKKGDTELKRLTFEGKRLLVNQLRRGRQTRRSRPEDFHINTVNQRHSRSSSNNTTQSSDARTSKLESSAKKSLGQPHSAFSSRDSSPSGSFGISLERRTRSSSGSVSSVVTDNASGNSTVDNLWKIRCSKCAFIYPNTQSLVQHMASTHLKPFKYNTFKKFPFECIYCERCFMTFFNYMNHVSQHTEIILSANQGIKCHKKTQRISMSKCQAELMAANPENVAGKSESVDKKHEEGIKKSDAIKRKYASMKDRTRDIGMNTQREGSVETTANSMCKDDAESSVMNLRYKRVYPLKQTTENISKSDDDCKAMPVNYDSALDDVSINAKKQKTNYSSMVENVSAKNTHVLRSARGNQWKNEIVSNVNIVSNNTQTDLTSQGHQDNNANSGQLKVITGENSKMSNNKTTNETKTSSDESSPLKRRCLDNRAFRELRRRATLQPFVWDLGDSHDKKQSSPQGRHKELSPPPCRSPDAISTRRSNRLSLPASFSSLDVIHERRKSSSAVVKTADNVTSASTQWSPTDVKMGKSKWKAEHMHKKGRMRIKYRRT